MGRRSAAESTGAIFLAFLTERTWRQPDLARRVGLSVKQLRHDLDVLSGLGMPLHRDEEGGQVYWSVDRTWYPEAVAVPRDSVRPLLRLLLRTPSSPARDRLVAKLLGAAHEITTTSVAAPRLEGDEETLDAVQDAADRRVALYLRYFSASRGFPSERHVSVQRLHPGPRPRFVAVCHRSGELRWFRVDSILRVRMDEREPYRAVDPDVLVRFERGSTDGFHQGDAPRRLAFVVPNPEAQWVRLNLLDGMQVEDLPDGIRVSIDTAAPNVVARFVVGLGGLARPESEELRRQVEALARGALEVSEFRCGGQARA